MKLRDSDFERLITEDGINVIDELTLLNNSDYYNKSLDIIGLSRAINLKRIQHLFSPEPRKEEK
jgi:hypothetical protein